jgi:hypothetical protein
MPRMTYPMIDNDGRLSYSPAGPIPWSTVIARERESEVAAYDGWTFAVEPATGWAGYSWLVTINNHPYLVDGETPPSDPGL